MRKLARSDQADNRYRVPFTIFDGHTLDGACPRIVPSFCFYNWGFFGRLYMSRLHKSRTHLLVCTTLASIGFMPIQALAAPAAGDQASTGLQEIIVTAQKRAEPLQKVPLAVTVVSGDSLARLSSNSLEDIVPIIRITILREQSI